MRMVSSSVAMTCSTFARHEEKASDGVALHLRVANGQLQYALNDGDPRVRAMGVPILI
jgi:hypothetical protein